MLSYTFPYKFSKSQNGDRRLGFEESVFGF